MSSNRSWPLFLWKVTLFVGIRLIYSLLLLVSKTYLPNLDWPYLFIDWVLTPCHRSKNVLKYALEPISIKKSFLVGWGGGGGGVGVGVQTKNNVYSRSIPQRGNSFWPDWIGWPRSLTLTLTRSSTINRDLLRWMIEFSNWICNKSKWWFDCSMQYNCEFNFNINKTKI